MSSIKQSYSNKLKKMSELPTSSDDDLPILVDSESSVSKLKEVFTDTSAQDFEVFNSALESVSKLKAELAQMRLGDQKNSS